MASGNETIAAVANGHLSVLTAVWEKKLECHCVPSGKQENYENFDWVTDYVVEHAVYFISESILLPS